MLFFLFDEIFRVHSSAPAANTRREDKSSPSTGPRTATSNVYLAAIYISKYSILFHKTFGPLLTPFCSSSVTESIPISPSRDQSFQVRLILVATTVFDMFGLGVIRASQKLLCFPISLPESPGVLQVDQQPQRRVSHHRLRGERWRWETLCYQTWGNKYSVPLL